MDAAGCMIEVTIVAAYPAVNITAAVSPIALPMEMIMPLVIPGMAGGSTTCCMVCQRVAPTA